MQVVMEEGFWTRVADFQRQWQRHKRQGLPLPEPATLLIYAFALPSQDDLGPEGGRPDHLLTIEGALQDRRMCFWSPPAAIESGLCRDFCVCLLDLQSQRPLLSPQMLKFALWQVLLHHHTREPTPTGENPFIAPAATPPETDPMADLIRSLLEACPSLPQAAIRDAVSSTLRPSSASPFVGRGALHALVKRLLNISLVMPRRLAGPMAVGIMAILSGLEAEYRRDGRQVLLVEVDRALVVFLTWLRDFTIWQDAHNTRSLTAAIIEGMSRPQHQQEHHQEQAGPQTSFCLAAPLALLYLMVGWQDHHPGLPSLLAFFLHLRFNDTGCWATELLCHAPRPLPRALLDSLLLPYLVTTTTTTSPASALRILCHQPATPPISPLLSTRLQLLLDDPHTHASLSPILLEHAKRLLTLPPLVASSPSHHTRPQSTTTPTTLTTTNGAAPCSAGQATASLPLSLSFLTSFLHPRGTSSPQCAALCTDAEIARSSIPQDKKRRRASAPSPPRVDPWASLPAESFALILSFLTPKRLAKAAICKSWSEATRCNLLWKGLYHRMWRGDKSMCLGSVPSMTHEPPEVKYTTSRCALCGGILKTQAAEGDTDGGGRTWCMMDPFVRMARQGKAPGRSTVSHNDTDWMRVYAARWKAQKRSRRRRYSAVCPVVGCAVMMCRGEEGIKAHMEQHEQLLDKVSVAAASPPRPRREKQK